MNKKISLIAFIFIFLIIIVIAADVTFPIIHLISPPNNTFSENLTQIFSVNITDDVQVSNLTLNIWNSTGNNIYLNNSHSDEAFGDGSDGEVIFTTGTKSYGNLVENDDYTVEENTLYLMIDREYNFTDFTLGVGTTLATSNSSGAVIYLNCQNTCIVNGSVLVRQSSVSTTTTSPTINGVQFTSPGVANGGSGGSGGGSLLYGCSFYGGSGGAQSNGYGGGVLVEGVMEQMTTIVLIIVGVGEMEVLGVQVVLEEVLFLFIILMEVLMEIQEVMVEGVLEDLEFMIMVLVNMEFLVLVLLQEMEEME